MRETGTMHLMAISGLHIALAASVIWFLARGIQFFLPGRWIIWQIPLLAGLIFAAFYAWLTGLQPPALRTAIALVVLAALKMSGRQWSPPAGMAYLRGGDLGFRSTGGPVTKPRRYQRLRSPRLFFWYQWLPLPLWQRGRCLRPLVTLLYLQVGMLLLLLPLQVLIFHGFSLSSLAANLFAVPLVTFISVPLILLGMFLHLFPVATLESIVWLAADKSLAGLFWLLMRLPNGWQDVDERWQYLTLLPWLLIIGWRFRAFSAVPAVCLAGSVVLAFPPLAQGQNRQLVPAYAGCRAGAGDGH